MSTPPLIQIIIGSTRVHRRADSIARWFAAIAEPREDLRTEIIDLRELDLPFLTDATPPMDAASRDPDAAHWSEKAASADGYVIVVPEYNHGYPAVVKNALDHLFSEWRRKPIGFVSYGGAGGGIRASEQLRQVAIELDMAPVRRQVAIPRIWAELDADGFPRDPHLADLADDLLGDMAWWAAALRAGRNAVEAPDVRTPPRIAPEPVLEKAS